MKIVFGLVDDSRELARLAAAHVQEQANGT
jgi:hypothetical protein